MDESTTTPTTPETPEAGGQEAVQPAAPEAQETTTSKYDFGKLQSALDEGKLTTDLLEDVLKHGPGWISNINKSNRLAADEKNQASKLRAELDKKLKEMSVSAPQKIDKPENHPGVQAMKRLADKLISEGSDETLVKDLMDRMNRLAAEDIERQEFIRKDDLERFFAEQAKKQETTSALQNGANQIAERYKIEPDVAFGLAAVFQDEDENVDDGVRKAIAWLEDFKDKILKEPKPKPKTTIVPPGTVPVRGEVMPDDDKDLARLQQEISARYKK